MNKLGLSCAKLRIVKLKIEDNKLFGLKENQVEKKLWGKKFVLGQLEKESGWQNKAIF